MLPELLEVVGVDPVEHLDMFAEQLERAVPLKFNDPSGHVGEEEPEIDMEHLPVPVQQDVAVVTILGLDDVHHQRIGGQTLHEVLLCSWQVVDEVNLEKLLEGQFHGQSGFEGLLETVKSD